MFVDEANVTLKAGDGGNGCAGFRREKFIPKGGPDGGDGGDGGNVYIMADDNVGDLEKFMYTPQVCAGDGAKGQTRRKTGQRGADACLHVPPGTIVFNCVHTCIRVLISIVYLSRVNQVNQISSICIQVFVVTWYA